LIKIKEDIHTDGCGSSQTYAAYNMYVQSLPKDTTAAPAEDESFAGLAAVGLMLAVLA
jgi:hypothetical protein